MSRNVSLPAFCLTCGYSEVPGQNFNRHECSDFLALPASEQAANKRASTDELRRRLAKPRATA